MAQNPKRRPNNLVPTRRRDGAEVQLADTAVGWGSARGQSAKPPRELQSQAGQPKQARKPKVAKAKTLKERNPKANLKK